MATAAMAAVIYAASVSKREGIDSVPGAAADKAHHASSHSDGTPSLFKNPHPSFAMLGVARILWTLIWYRLSGRWADTSPPTVAVHKPALLADRGGSGDKLRATWLGHACYYVEFPSGLRVLFDPVFEDRCGPQTFIHDFGPKRFTPRPCDIAELPFVDAVVISHSHYDHLSHPTVREIHERFPRAHFFVGLGLASWFRKSGIDCVTEMDWWDDADLTLTPAKSADDDGPTEPITARLSCLPCQHTSGRTGRDRDTTLWCCWGVTSPAPSSGSATPSPPAKSVFFGGDTGYRTVPPGAADNGWAPEHADLPRNPDFAHIGQHRGPFDLGLIPIGAYAPREVLSPVHADPGDAVEIFRDTRCKRAMAIHWGTWSLSPEAVLEPPVLLRKALKSRGMAETGVFDSCDIGESREF